MLIESAASVFLEAVSKVLGEAAADLFRDRNGRTVTIPVRLLEQAVVAHLQLAEQARQSTRQLAEAISLLNEHRYLVLVEAPTVAVQASEAMIARQREVATAMRPDATPVATSSEVGDAASKSREIRERIQDAYPDTHLRFDE